MKIKRNKNGKLYLELRHRAWYAKTKRFMEGFYIVPTIHITRRIKNVHTNFVEFSFLTYHAAVVSIPKTLVDYI